MLDLRLWSSHSPRRSRKSSKILGRAAGRADPASKVWKVRHGNLCGTNRARRPGGYAMLSVREGLSLCGLCPPVLITAAVTSFHVEHAWAPTESPKPVTRRLRVFADDPTLDAAPRHAGDQRGNATDGAWEGDLPPGPVGEYIEVVDVDPASRAC